MARTIHERGDWSGKGNRKRLARERATWLACLEPQPIERKEVAPTALAIAIEAEVAAATQRIGEQTAKPRMLRDARQLTLWIPPKLHERLTGLLDGQPVSGLVGELLGDWLAEREGKAVPA